ncbi:MAG: 4'-phosphopantetheinyl transferase superfamily protein [Muriicola sp.]|nr:4'-phosphopantetheinyl transferase superfamily protein [Muriicola sp.]
MPLYKTITINPGIRVHIWKISEAEEDLARGITLTPHCQERYEGMKSELHRRGFLSIRHLMAEEGYKDHDLYYDDLGKPHLKDGSFISITHSYQFSGIVVSENIPVGIDIEKQREKILKIAHKFTPIEEYGTFSDPYNLMRKLTVVWGAKESLYKINSTLGLSFLNNIDIEDFQLESGKTKGLIHLNGQSSFFEIHFNEYEGFTCAFAMQLKSKGSQEYLIHNNKEDL